MKRFILLHFGFEKPMPEMMAPWGKWFESVAEEIASENPFIASIRVYEISEG